MMKLKLSHHAEKKHYHEKWNPITIRDAYQNGILSGVELFEGETADILFGIAPDGEEVGLVLSKPNFFGTRVIVTGYAASREYWKSI